MKNTEWIDECFKKCINVLTLGLITHWRTHKLLGINVFFGCRTWAVFSQDFLDFFWFDTKALWNLDFMEQNLSGNPGEIISSICEDMWVSSCVYLAVHSLLSDRWTDGWMDTEQFSQISGTNCHINQLKRPNHVNSWNSFHCWARLASKLPNNVYSYSSHLIFTVKGVSALSVKPKKSSFVFLK